MSSKNLLDFIGIRYLDSLVSGAMPSGYVTKDELAEVEAIAKRAYHYKGTVDALEDLPASGNIEGDVWNVGANLDGGNYAWASDSYAWQTLPAGTLPYRYKGVVASPAALPSSGVAVYDAYGIAESSDAEPSAYYVYGTDGEWSEVPSGIDPRTPQYEYAGELEDASALPASGMPPYYVYRIAETDTYYAYAPVPEWHLLPSGTLPYSYKGFVSSAAALPSTGVSAYDAYGIAASSEAVPSQYFAYTPAGQWAAVSSGVDPRKSPYSYAGFVSSVDALPSSSGASAYETYGIASGASATPTAFYACNSGDWDRLGGIVDLEPYVTFSQYANAQSAGVMSPMDKAKLDSVDPGAKNVSVDSALNANSNRPVANSAVTSALDDKLNRNIPASYVISGEEVIWSQNGAMLAEDKIKLDAIASSANYFVLSPATDVSLGGVIVDAGVYSTYVDSAGSWTLDPVISGPYEYKGAVPSVSALPAFGAKQYDLWSVPSSYQSAWSSGGSSGSSWIPFYYACTADSCTWVKVSSGLKPSISSSWPEVFSYKGDKPLFETLPRFGASKYDVWGISASGADSASEYWYCASAIDKCQWQALPPEPYNSVARISSTAELPLDGAVAGDVYGYSEGPRPMYYLCTAASCIWSALPSGLDPNSWPFSYKGEKTAANALPVYGAEENDVWGIPFSSGTSSGASYYVCTVGVESSVEGLYQKLPLRTSYSYKGEVASVGEIPMSGAKLWHLYGIESGGSMGYYVCTLAASASGDARIPESEVGYHVVRNSAAYSAISKRITREDSAVAPVNFRGGSAGTIPAADLEKLRGIPSNANHFELTPATTVSLGGVIVDPQVYTTYADVNSWGAFDCPYQYKGVVSAVSALPAFEASAYDVWGVSSAGATSAVYYKCTSAVDSCTWSSIPAEPDPTSSAGYSGTVASYEALPKYDAATGDIYGISGASPSQFYKCTVDGCSWASLDSGAPYEYKGVVADSAHLPASGAKVYDIYGIASADPSAYFICTEVKQPTDTGTSVGASRIPKSEAGYHVVQNAAVYSALSGKITRSDYAEPSVNGFGGSAGTILASDLEKLRKIPEDANHFELTPATTVSLGGVIVDDGLYVTYPDVNSWGSIDAPYLYKGGVAAVAGLPKFGARKYDVMGIDGASPSSYYKCTVGVDSCAWSSIASTPGITSSAGYKGLVAGSGDLPKSGASIGDIYGIESASPSQFYECTADSCVWASFVSGAPYMYRGDVANAAALPQSGAKVHDIYGIEGASPSAYYACTSRQAAPESGSAKIPESEVGYHVVQNAVIVAGMSSASAVFNDAMSAYVPIKGDVVVSGAKTFESAIVGNVSCVAISSCVWSALADGAPYKYKGNVVDVESLPTTGVEDYDVMGIAGASPSSYYICSSGADGYEWTAFEDGAPYMYRGNVNASTALPEYGAKAYDLYGIQGASPSQFYACTGYGEAMSSCDWQLIANGAPYKYSGDVSAVEMLPRFGASQYDVWGISASGAVGASEYYKCILGVDSCLWTSIASTSGITSGSGYKGLVSSVEALPASTASVGDIYGIESASPSQFYECTVDGCGWASFVSGEPYMYKGLVAGEDALPLFSASVYDLYGIESASPSRYYVCTGSSVMLSGGTAFHASSATFAESAAIAGKLETARTISLEGDASGSCSFDGSVNVTISTTVPEYSWEDGVGGVKGLVPPASAGDVSKVLAGNGTWVDASAIAGNFVHLSGNGSDATAVEVVNGAKVFNVSPIVPNIQYPAPSLNYLGEAYSARYRFIMGISATGSTALALPAASLFNDGTVFVVTKSAGNEFKAFSKITTGAASSQVWASGNIFDSGCVYMADVWTYSNGAWPVGSIGSSGGSGNFQIATCTNRGSQAGIVYLTLVNSNVGSGAVCIVGEQASNGTPPLQGAEAFSYGGSSWHPYNTAAVGDAFYAKTTMTSGSNVYSNTALWVHTGDGAWTSSYSGIQRAVNIGYILSALGIKDTISAMSEFPSTSSGGNG